MTVTKTREHITIERKEWERMKKNPALSEALELLEDLADFETAKQNGGRSVSITRYLKKRGLQNTH